MASHVAAISIPTTHELSLPYVAPFTPIHRTDIRSKPHTIYQIQVQLASSLQSYRLTKRFSDFVALDSALRATISNSADKSGGRRLEVSLPPKTFLSKPDVEQRRVQLEVYLRYLCTNSAWCGQAEVVKFLQLPEGAARAREEREERGDFYGGVRNVKRELQIARRWLVSPPSSSASNAVEGGRQQHAPVVEAKKHIATADRLLERVQRHAREPVSKQEARRRADIVEELGREVMALVELAGSKRPTPQQQDPSFVSGDGTAFGDDRIRLLAGAAPKGRVLGGPAKETPETLQLSNEDLLQQQKDQISEQDKLLDDLLPILRRQRELGESIAKEVEEQSEVLDEIEGGVDAVERKMRRGRKQMDKLK